MLNMSEQLDTQGQTMVGTTHTAENRLIVKPNTCHRENLASQSALSHPRHLVFSDGYRKLANAAEATRAKVEAVRGTGREGKISCIHL
jgi:hypothetical protein